MLARHNVKFSDIVINVNFSLSPALMSGQVDAVIGAFRNFELNQMDIEGVAGRCFYLEEEGIPSYDELIYVANQIKWTLIKYTASLNIELATQFIINNTTKLGNIFRYR